MLNKFSTFWHFELRFLLCLDAFCTQCGVSISSTQTTICCCCCRCCFLRCYMKLLLLYYIALTFMVSNYKLEYAQQHCGSYLYFYISMFKTLLGLRHDCFCGNQYFRDRTDLVLSYMRQNRFTKKIVLSYRRCCGIVEEFLIKFTEKQGTKSRVRLTRKTFFKTLNRCLTYRPRTRIASN